MSAVLHVKGATGGLNSDRLGERNCEYSLWPLPVSERAKGLAVIAKEHRFRLGSELTVGLLDLHRSWATDEPATPFLKRSGDVVNAAHGVSRFRDRGYDP